MACPSCFAAMFAGMRFCPACGAEAARQVVGDRPSITCPGCGEATHAVKLGETVLDECPSCGGAWLDAAAFRTLCAGREERAALLDTPLAAVPDAPAPLGVVRYANCPACKRLMSRVNFARASGIMIDVCREHGVWFDRGELHRLVRFIDGGGLERAKVAEQRHQREMERLEQERQRIAAIDTSWVTPPHAVAGTRPGTARTWSDDDTLRAIVDALHHLFT